MSEKLPEHYRKMQGRFGQVMTALSELGKATDEAGPLPKATAHLVQLAAAAALRSEGAVHSHVRRAQEAGATPEEIRHALVLTIPTVGYSTAAAALSWADDILEG